jgi:hypothetical protein
MYKKRNNCAESNLILQINRVIRCTNIHLYKSITNYLLKIPRNYSIFHYYKHNLLRQKLYYQNANRKLQRLNLNSKKLSLIFNK